MATADWTKKTSEAPESLRRQWRADRALRPAMRSPGGPDPSRAVQRQFWRLIATGVSSAEAAITVGVSVPVGMRWFRHAGGMAPSDRPRDLAHALGLGAQEGDLLALLERQVAARRLGQADCDPGTVSRELRRNAATRGGNPEYRAVVAQWKAQQAAKRPKTAKLVGNGRLRDSSLTGSPGRSEAPAAPSWPDRRRRRGRD